MEQLLSIISPTIIVLILIFTVWLSIQSNIIRDGVVDPTAFMTKAATIPKYAALKFEQIPRCYSLARTQLAIWTVVIGSIYIQRMLCGIHCTANPSLSSTALSLLGISAGTTALGGIIDQSQATQPADSPRSQDEPSSGFFNDILSDENGVSIHRFQNVVWTFLAVVVFLYKAYTVKDCQLPTLDGTIISLSGISSATYLGLKINENR